MFKAILHEKQILIVLLGSILIFIGYNVLTVAVEATESDDKKVCEDYNGKWKNIGGGDRGCVFEKDSDREKYSIRPGFSLDSTGSDAEYGIEDLVTYDNEGNKIYPNTETDSSKQQQEERAKMTQSKSFERFVESKGIDIDDDYHWLSAQEQEEIETEFKEDKSDEYEEEINNKDNKEKEDEGKRYVNPDGGAPLYEEELTEDEKDYYEEYKPEKEDSQQIEDWRNEVEPIEDVKISSPFLTVPIDKDDDEKEIDEKVEKYIADYNEKEEEAYESNDVEEEEEESDDDKSEDDEQEEDEPEEENSDSES